MAGQYQYAQSYVVAPAPAAGQYAPAYDPAAYTPVPYQPAQYGYPYANRDELRTVFVTGFPPDFKDRELTNTCRFMPGYEARPCLRPVAVTQGALVQAHHAPPWAPSGMIDAF